MPNPRYNEDEKDGTASLDSKVKGKVGSGANFKEFSSPDGSVDSSKADPNGTGVKMPQDSAPKLPKAGETV